MVLAIASFTFSVHTRRPARWKEFLFLLLFGCAKTFFFHFLQAWKDRCEKERLVHIRIFYTDMYVLG
jgi:hypothetical protein